MKSDNAVSLLTERSKRAERADQNWFILIENATRSRRINLGLASHARTCVRARMCVCARAPAQPECLQNTWIRYHHRVTHTCLRAGVHLLQFVYVHQERFNHKVLTSTCCTISTFVHFAYTETFLLRTLIVRSMWKMFFVCSLKF